MADFEVTCGRQRAGFRQEIHSAQRKSAWCLVLVALTEVFGWMWPVRVDPINVGAIIRELTKMPVKSRGSPGGLTSNYTFLRG